MWDQIAQHWTPRGSLGDLDSCRENRRTARERPSTIVLIQHFVLIDDLWLCMRVVETQLWRGSADYFYLKLDLEWATSHDTLNWIPLPHTRGSHAQKFIKNIRTQKKPYSKFVINSLRSNLIPLNAQVYAIRRDPDSTYSTHRAQRSSSDLGGGVCRPPVEVGRESGYKWQPKGRSHVLPDEGGTSHWRGSWGVTSSYPLLVTIDPCRLYMVVMAWGQLRRTAQTEIPIKLVRNWA